jgi:hypothetical protein
MRLVWAYFALIIRNLPWQVVGHAGSAGGKRPDAWT